MHGASLAWLMNRMKYSLFVMTLRSKIKHHLIAIGKKSMEIRSYQKIIVEIVRTKLQLYIVLSVLCVSTYETEDVSFGKFCY